MYMCKKLCKIPPFGEPFANEGFLAIFADFFQKNSEGAVLG